MRPPMRSTRPLRVFASLISGHDPGPPDGHDAGHDRGDGGSWYFVRRGETKTFIRGMLPGWDAIFSDLEDTTDDSRPIQPLAKAIVGGFFPETGWDPNLRAALFAADFTTSPDWHKATDPGNWYSGRYLDTQNLPEVASGGYPAHAREKLTKELKELWEHMSERRPERTDEIALQADDISSYWGKLLVCSPTIRPSLWLLTQAALQIAGLVVAYQKMKYSRPRPAQVWTAISPTIATPGHPSYPSGHAAQGWLIAAFAKLVAPELSEECDRLGSRIGVNREIAGVHYPSDTKAGKWVAERIMDILCGVDRGVRQADPSQFANRAFGDLVLTARAEWRSLAVRPGTAPGIVPDQAHAIEPAVTGAAILAPSIIED